MKSLFDAHGIPHYSSCLELKLSYPCPVCKGRIDSKWYDTCCCWINQHYYEIKHHHGSSWMTRSDEEARKRFEFLLLGDGINATIPERLLYLQTTIELTFPRFLPMIRELAERHSILLP